MAARWINQAKWWTLGLGYVIYQTALAFMDALVSKC